ncbi:MAG: hypothetical protein WC143_08500 [Eubacteriales bacterium]|jgi:hypothetical protein
MMHKRKFWLSLISGFICFLFLTVPIGIWIYINRVKYLAIAQSTTMSIGFIIAIIFVALLLIGAFKDIDKRVNGVIWMGFFTGIFWLIDPIIYDLKWIALCALISLIGYVVFSKITKNAWDYVKTYKKEKVRIEARQEAEEETTPLALHM